MNGQFKSGELYRYSPDDGKWCRHGLRLIREFDGRLFAVDTYWGDYQMGDPRLPESIADNLEFLLDLSDARTVSREEWYQYADKDRAYIPMGGGAECNYVRKDAPFDPQRRRKYLEEQVDNAARQIRVGQRELVRAEIALAEFIKQTQ